MIVFAKRTIAKLVAIVVATMAAFHGASAAQAQDDAQLQTNQQLLACDRMSNPEKRLDCFNAVVGGLKQRPAAADAELPPVAVGSADTPVADAPVVAETTPAVPAVVTNDTAEVLAAHADSKDDFGLEDQKAKAVRQREREKRKSESKEPVYATIIDAWRTIDGRFEVRLDNGQVWRETAGTRLVRMPKEGSSVRITSGSLGSYRMKIDNDNRLAAVRRTK